MARRALSIALALAVFSAVPAKAVPLPPGTQAPDFAKSDLAGKPVSLKALRGKIVLVDFWASWCPPCLIEIPHLIALKKKQDGRFEIIGVSMDDDSDSAREVAVRHPFNYPLVMGDVGLGKSFGGVLGLPALFLIGRDGKVIAHWRGEVAPEEIDKAVAAAVAKP